MSVSRKRAKGAGRKARGEFANKVVAFTTRLTPATRTALEKAAVAAGRSISQEAERRLAQSLGSPAGLADRIYGNPDGTADDRRRWRENKALAALLGKAAAVLESYTAASWRADRFTFEALAHAAVILLRAVAPAEVVALPPPLELKDRPTASPPERIVAQFPHFATPQIFGATIAGFLVHELQQRAALPPLDVRGAPDHWYQMPEMFDALGLNEHTTDRRRRT